LLNDFHFKNTSKKGVQNGQKEKRCIINVSIADGVVGFLRGAGSGG
jgi:hypothetical protein